MIDFSEVYKHLRTAIKSRFDTEDYSLSVIQARTTGVKPKGLYATLDVIGNFNSNSVLTNKYLREKEDGSFEQVYETHKDIIITISFRNGDPENFTDQMKVQTMCNNMAKAFEEEGFLQGLYDSLSATVKSVSRIRNATDPLPTGFGNVSIFNVVVSMVDTTSENKGVIENVEFGIKYIYK